MIYISGPIGKPDVAEANRKVFYAAEDELRAGGAAVFNPCRHIPGHPKNMADYDDVWRWYMRQDIRALTQCDAIYMLPGWQNSKGACWEFRIAQMLGLHMMYAPVLDNQSDPSCAVETHFIEDFWK